MNKKFISIFLAFLLVIFLVYAATFYKVNNGTTATINEHGVCQKVTNAAGLAIFVPTATAAEWSAFRTYKPAGVTLGACTASCAWVVDTSFSGEACLNNIARPACTSSINGLYYGLDDIGDPGNAMYCLSNNLGPFQGYQFRSQYRCVCS